MATKRPIEPTRALYTLPEIAGAKRISEKRLRRAIQAGELPAVSLGQRWLRVTLIDVDAWLEARQYTPRLGAHRSISK